MSHVPKATHLTTVIAFVLAAGCAISENPRSFQEVGSFHAPNMHSLYPTVTHFVVAPRVVMNDRNTVLAFARRTCGERDDVCFVLFWTDDAGAARALPLSASQADAMVASYSRSGKTGHDGFQCYDFESPRVRCRRK